MFKWLKDYLPRGLYWRGALILLLPFLALQVIVSIVFIQRHFEDVTEQMTLNQRPAMDLILNALSEEGTKFAQIQVARPLGFDVSEEAAPFSGNRRIWYDISGLTVIRDLRAHFDVQAIDLTLNRQVLVWIMHRGTSLRIMLPRRYVSARNPHQLLVVMMLAGIFVTLISFAFLRNQLRPIRRLARASEAFGRGRSIPYAPAGAVEVRAAGSAFLDMRARIERQIEQRTLLLSGVSHDLRTPLTRLRLGLSMLPADEETDALKTDVDDMSQMIDAFLDFAREGAEEEPEQTDLIGLAIDVVGVCDRTDRPVALNAPAMPIIIGVRPHALKRALGNLITNAQRYGTRVWVTVDVLERSVRLRVEDDGPGIPPADRNRALRPFARLDSARSQNRGGSVGLGLSIAADIARRHGGTLRLGESADHGGLMADIVLAR